MAIIEFRNVDFYWGKDKILEDISFKVNESEIFALLGPSGCGKSTMLRLISGLSRPSSGKVLIYGQDASVYKGRDRCVATVWQSKALFPHLSVRANIEFGLRVKRINRSDIRKKGEKIAEALRLENKLDRSIFQLSGGEQQRVALARALIIEPKILLLDEPFTGLDQTLKLQLQADLRELQADYGCTYILVSHLSEDVFSLAMRIAVIQNKKILQVGDPNTLYHSPKSTFVAKFVGKKNLIPSIVRNIERNGREVIVSSTNGRGNWKARNLLNLELNENDEVVYVIGADSIELDHSGDCILEARFRAQAIEGRRKIYYFSLDKGCEVRVETCTIDSNVLYQFERAGTVKLYWKSENAFLLKE